jgi:hypothetical protein
MIPVQLPSFFFRMPLLGMLTPFVQATGRERRVLCPSLPRSHQLMNLPHISRSFSAR